MTDPALYEKALALKEIENRLKKAKKPIDSEARETFERNFDPGDRKTVWREIDGKRVLLGDLSRDRPGDPVRAVTDRDSFEEWVAAHFPDRVHTRVVEVREVDPDFVEQVLADGHAVHPGTGEILLPAGVTEQAPRTPAFRITPAPGILEALAAGEIAGLLELEGPANE